MKKNRSYADDWNEYVRNSSTYSKMEPTNKGRTDLIYPGDEWGTIEEWTAYSNKFLKPFLPDDSSGIAVELGQGSGKYTLQVIDKISQIICFDVSEEFVKIAKERLRPYAGKNKVNFELLKLQNCNEIVDILRRRNLIGKIDLFFSVDSMVHVELHTLIAYFINAFQCLKLGGHITMSVASCTNDAGFARLLEEIPWCYGGMRPSHQFYFLSKDIICFILLKLGFEIVIFDEQRDINFVAKKIEESSFILKGID